MSVSAPKHRFAWIGAPLIAGAVALGAYELLRFPVVLHESTSEFNHIVVEEGRDGVRSLRFEEGGAIQSAVDPDDLRHLELPYTRAMTAALAAVDDPRRALMIGLGGGALPSFVRALYPELSIDVIELDPDVVDVAKRYFGFVEDEKLRVVVGDGRHHVEHPDARRRDLRYDLVLLDAYGEDSVPAHLTTLEFLESVRARLVPGGVLAANVWGPDSNRLHDAMLRTYQEAFSEVCVVSLRGRGNRIFLAATGPLPEDAAAFARRAREESERRGYGFDLAALVEGGYRRPPRRDSDQILRDR